MSDTIKQAIIRYIESQGNASKSKIEDYIKETIGTTGDTCSRRMRELVAEGTIRKIQRDYEGKKYWDYSVVEPTFSELAGSVDSRTGLIQLTEMGKSIWKEKVAKNIEQAEKLNL